MGQLEFSIIKKEWIKLKYVFFSAVVVGVCLLAYFAYDLRFTVTSVEPESVAWYRFAHLGYKPYEFFIPYFIAFGALIALAQFLPERINKRVKIIAHLPLPLYKSIFIHLLVGLLFIVTFLLFFSLIFLSIISSLYPEVVVLESAKDMLFFTIGSIIIYLGISATILEQIKIKALIKLFVLGVVVAIFYKDHFVLSDLVWVYILLLMPFVVLDSFYSIKQSYLKNSVFITGVGLGLVFLGFAGFDRYKDEYSKEFEGYYIFYSPTLKDFVYQKNLGDHNFEYGTKSISIPTQKEYEEYLPFVFWSNLSIQNRLPIIVDGASFDRERIKNSRLSLTYKPSYLKQDELNLYPLLNPISTQGVIKFPEEAISFLDNSVAVYHFDKGIDKALTQRLNKKLKEAKVSMPIKNVWGKMSNMKPFDLGFIIKDSSDKLYNIRRGDNKIYVKNIKTPKNSDIVYLRISENRQKVFAGYAIDKRGDFYLLGFENFEFVKIPLKNFDYKTMKLKLLSDPLHYTIRYDDGTRYYAEVFDKDLEKIDSIKLDYTMF